MGVDDLPEIVHGAAAITGHGEVLVHEGRTHVLGIQPIADLVLDRDGIAGADDILGRMLRRIAAVHPEARGIQTLAFHNHFRDVIAFAALVAGAPEQDAGVVTVPQYHLLHPFPVHLRKLRPVGHVFRSMRLIAGLVDHVEAVFVSQVQVFVHGRIV